MERGGGGSWVETRSATEIAPKGLRRVNGGLWPGAVLQWGLQPGEAIADIRAA